NGSAQDQAPRSAARTARSSKGRRDPSSAQPGLAIVACGEKKAGHGEGEAGALVCRHDYDFC
ncbi:hypothetical protein, partial [Bordetella tumbae]|uniref:hypothetical protein n=1 Tax=Bordetella tumbae TaxID=1649139 RepID=UPI0039EE3DD4